ncbi:MAG: Druantia anti-phage system protein DruA [Dissulfuribacterales bacterium]
MNFQEDIPVIQCGRCVSHQEIELIRETVNLFPQLSRTELVQTVCEHLEWFTASGSNKRDACLRLLEKLESCEYFQLPQKKEKKNPKTTFSISFSSKTQSCPEITGSLGLIGKVRLEVIKDKESENLWKEYMSRYHYLGNTRPFGFYLRYFIRSEHELLGCALFSGAAKSISIRDQWIGWTTNQRLRNLSRVVNNTRFLIFPWVKVRYLASHVLGLAARRIKQDWYEKWGYYPVLMETFVDNYYQGTCYKAANWRHLGMTTGVGLVRKGKSYATTPKKIFVKALTKGFREELCSDGLVGRTEI